MKKPSHRRPPSQAVQSSVPSGADVPLTDEVLADIQNGGRYRTAMFCVSILILSFRRSMGVRYVPAGQSNAGSALIASIITSLFGWWGIPWGPIYSIGSLIANFNGGKDVTLDVLSAHYDEAEAKGFLAGCQKSPATPGLWGLRALILGGPVLTAFLLLAVGAVSSKAEKERLASDPSYRAYHELIDSISSDGGGNTPEAREIAKKTAVILDKMVDETLKAEGATVSSSDCSSACYQSSKGTMLLVRLSSMTKFSDDAKQEIVDSIWEMASAGVASPEKKDHQLIVGVGGRFLWDGARIGVLPSTGGDAIEPKVRATSGVEDQLEGALGGIWVPAE